MDVDRVHLAHAALERECKHALAAAPQRVRDAVYLYGGYIQAESEHAKVSQKANQRNRCEEARRRMGEKGNTVSCIYPN